jgi:uncharacterized DUF497 family protein
LGFEGERCLIGPDRIDGASGEQRWHAIGAVQMESRIVAVLLVVHVYREDYYGEEIIRIGSARAAEERDIRRYQKEAMD